MRWFEPRRGTRGVRMFMAGALLLAAFGAAVAAAGEAYGWGVLVLGLAMEAVLVLQAARPGWRYGAGPEGVVVRTLLRTHELPRARIRAAEVVDGPAVAEVLAGPREAEAAAGRSMRFTDGMRARREQAATVAWCTAPVVLTATRRADQPGVVRLGAVAPGQFVLLHLDDGSVRAVSPRDVEGFVAALGQPAPG